MQEKNDYGELIPTADLMLLVDALPLLPWISDAQGTLIWIGPQWATATGWTIESLLGMSGLDLLGPEDRRQVEDAYLKWNKLPQPFESECRLQVADGSYRWFSVWAMPVPDPITNQTVRWVGACSDIDDQKKLARQADAQAASVAEAYLREHAARRQAEVNERRVQVVADVAHALARTISLDAVLGAAVETVASAFEHGGSAIWLHEEKSATLRLVASRGYNEEGVRLLAAMTEDAPTVAADAFRRQDVVIIYSNGPNIPSLTQHLFKVSDRPAATVAATPLFVSGRVLGVMTLIARDEPLAEVWVETLRAVGTQVAAAVERATLYEREREIAARLQGALLPALEDQAVLIATGLAVAHRYRPGTEGMTVGGDFYDVWSLPDLNGEKNDGALSAATQRLAVVLGDISGKGLEAAVQTAAIRHAVQAYAHEDPTPERVVARVSELTLALNLLPTGFATMFFAVIDAATGQVDYCSAGHESLLLRNSMADDIERLSSTAPAIGLTGDLQTISAGKSHIEPGGELVLYTDGITEARDPKTRKPLGVEGLISLLTEVHATLEEQSNAALIAASLLTHVENYAGGRLEDDAALLVIVRPALSTLSTGVAATSRLSNFSR